MTILIIDDEPAQRRPLVRLLRRRLQAECLEADNFAEALALRRERDFDAIVLDLVLPDSTVPLETCARIRELDSDAVIVLTGHGDKETAFAAVQAGALDFFVKGMAADLLATRIGMLVDHRAPTRDLSSRVYDLRSEQAGKPATFTIAGIPFGEKTEKALLWIVQLALLAGVFWIKLNFVSIADFDAYKKAEEERRIELGRGLKTINDTLIRIDGKMDTIADHEARIRALEHRP